MIILSREIKFRVYDGSSMLYQDRYNSLGDNITSLDFKESKVIINNLYNYESVYYFNDENFSIMQFTGLKDSEGNEIYEKDIVWNSWDEDYQVIIFEEGEYKLKGENSLQILWKSLGYIDICGNVYENVELIGGKYND